MYLFVYLKIDLPFVWRFILEEFLMGKFARSVVLMSVL